MFYVCRHTVILFSLAFIFFFKKGLGLYVSRHTLNVYVDSCGYNLCIIQSKIFVNIINNSNIIMAIESSPVNITSLCDHVLLYITGSLKQSDTSLSPLTLDGIVKGGGEKQLLFCAIKLSLLFCLSFKEQGR